MHVSLKVEGADTFYNVISSEIKQRNKEKSLTSQILKYPYI